MVKTATKPVIHNFTGDENAVKGIIVPDGGTLFVVRTRVNPAWPWPDMLKEACPNYQSSDVQAVADLFPPQAGKLVGCYVYGLNFGHGIPNTQPAVDWGKKQDNLHEATPRHVYSVARDVPDLNRKVGMSWMYLVAPKFVTFEGDRRVCGANFDGAERKADLHWFDLEWDDRDWFGFFRECTQS